MSAPRRPWLPVAVLAVLGALVLSVGGCADGSGDDAPTATQAGRLELTVEPRTGDAPLEVRFEARLLGAVAGGGCPSLAWDFGNGDVMIAQASGCREDDAPTAFGVTYTYPAAGAYEPFVRLLASDVAPSGAVQVLVGGASPTPPAVAALPGPTIIIATPMPPGVGTGATSGTPTAPATATAAPATAIATKGAPAPAPPRATPTRAMAAIPVLPADLFYIDAEEGLLWRLRADGGAPEPLPETGAPIEAYAVSSAGAIATTRGGRLTLTVPGGAPRTLAEAASAPVWSRDGRLLAYAADGVWVLDVAQDRGRRLAQGGAPLAFSGDGRLLAVRGADGAPVAVQVADGVPLRLPLPPVTTAGWLPDRPVAWLGGAGLHLATVDETPTLGRLLEETALVVEAVVRSDLRLMALADRGDGLRAFEVDLTDPVPAAAAAGPILQIGPGAGYAWAPDGRTAAVAAASGLSLLDTRTGALVPVVARATRDPQWVLVGR